MEPTPRKEKDSIVSRLFGFGRKKEAETEPQPEAEQGFAATAKAQRGPEEAPDNDSRIRIPEQVIRVKTSRLKKEKGADAVETIREGFTELTSLLSNVNQRLESQDSQKADLVEQFGEVPEFLRSLPRLQEDQNRHLGAIADRMSETSAATERMSHAVERLPEIHEEQSRALGAIADQVADGNQVAREMAERLSGVPEALQQGVEVHQEALQKSVSAQQNIARVVHAGQQKTLQLVHQATQRTLESANKAAKVQQRQLQEMMSASVQNMRRMFFLAGAFMAAAIVAVAAMIWLG